MQNAKPRKGWPAAALRTKMAAAGSSLKIKTTAMMPTALMPAATLPAAMMPAAVMPAALGMLRKASQVPVVAMVLLPGQLHSRLTQGQVEHAHSMQTATFRLSCRVPISHLDSLDLGRLSRLKMRQQRMLRLVQLQQL